MLTPLKGRAKVTRRYATKNRIQKFVMSARIRRELGRQAASLSLLETNNQS
jgi:hypothetical protein